MALSLLPTFLSLQRSRSCSAKSSLRVIFPMILSGRFLIKLFILFVVRPSIFSVRIPFFSRRFSALIDSSLSCFISKSKTSKAAPKASSFSPTLSRVLHLYIGFTPKLQAHRTLELDPLIGKFVMKVALFQHFS